MILKNNHKRKYGFSIIELAVVLAISAITLGASIYAMRNQSDYFNVLVTKTKLDSISLALESYKEKFGAYPCPAPLNAAPSVDGIAASTCTTCPNTYGPNPYYCIPGNNVIIGAIPFRTLGLGNSTGYDAWLNKIIYAIDNRYTVGICQIDSHIKIIDQNGFQISNTALYALLSPGFDQQGGFDYTGNLIKTCNIGTPEGQNCAFTISSANFSSVFRYSAINKSSSVNTYYDDIIKWQSNPGHIYYPAQIGNCILWMDGADVCSVTTNSGNQVTSWLDKSPSQLNATVPSSSNPPAFTNAAASLLNKNSYLTFNAASSNLLSIAGTFSALPLTNFTEIIVFRTSTKALGAITAAAQGVNYISTADRQLGPTASGQIGFSVQGGGQINSSSVLANGQAYITTITVDSSAGGRMFINGIQAANSSTQTSSTLTTNSFLIGGNSAWGYYTGDLMEVLVYNKVLSNTERVTVELYLATKWGIPY